jgi:hypothetical protein
MRQTVCATPPKTVISRAKRGIQARESRGRSDLGLWVCRRGYRFALSGYARRRVGLDVNCSPLAMQVTGESIGHECEAKKVHELPSVTRPSHMVSPRARLIDSISIVFSIRITSRNDGTAGQ